MSKIVMGNWKMNGTLREVQQLLQDILVISNNNCVVFPPSVYLPEAQSVLNNTPISWGAQNVHCSDSGAYTGEISAPMVKEFGCKYVLVGHSERRHIFKEDEKFVAEKFHQVKEHGMIPVLCVGENIVERNQGLTETVIERQLSAIADSKQNSFYDCVIAYEPVWAIGTGLSATPEQAQLVHKFIRNFVARYDAIAATQISILYGGSVKSSNAHEIFSMPDVDGGLIGGASLCAPEFVEIVECIS